MQLFTRVFDVGYSDRAIEPAEIRFILNDALPFPSADLIQKRSKVAGEFGFMDTSSAEWPSYLSFAKREIRKHLKDNVLVVLPEFGGSEPLTSWIAKTLRRHGSEARCCVVAGSYYRHRDGAVQSVCPVVLPDGTVIEQLKFQPALDEKDHGCTPQTHGILHVFQNTGFGDFAVLVCSDALPERCEPAIEALRGRIDILVVIARNLSEDLPNHLRRLSAQERWVVAYCNGERADSGLYLPLHHERPRQGSERGGEINIMGLHRKLIESPELFARITEATRFAPQPRHFSTSGRSAIDMRRYPKVLAVGSHFDDIWLGCSATLMLLREVYGASVCCISLCTDYPNPYFGQYRLKDRTGELNAFCKKLCDGLGFHWVQDLPAPTGNITDREFAGNAHELRQQIFHLWKRYQDADLVFVPRRDDAHEDHVLTARMVLAQFKKSTVLEYEVKEFRRIPFQPSLIVDVSRRSRRELLLDGETIFAPADDGTPAAGTFAQKKARILKSGFGAFLKGEVPGTFEEDHTLGRMRVRAAESSGEPRFAEAFATEILIS